MSGIPLSSLPSVSGAETVKALEKDGWTVVRSKGDHVMLTKPGELANISVPQHRELKRPTLKQILIHAGLSAEEFKNLL
jgi:predicted RNA binding protein YcfA (HicA-like mRNA interferase family)